MASELTVGKLGVGAAPASTDSLFVKGAGTQVIAIQGDGGAGPKFTMRAGGTFTISEGDSTPRLNIGATGIVTIYNGIAVTTGGIKFPATQSASADVNTLDDYEEGSWTGTYTGSGGASGVTYSTNTCTYTKVGRLVTCQAHVVLSDKGTVGGVTKIIGLPFTPSAVPQFVTGALAAGNFTLDADQQMVALQYGANAFFYLFVQEPGTSLVQATATQTNDTSEFVMTCSYNTA